MSLWRRLLGARAGSFRSDFDFHAEQGLDAVRQDGGAWEAELSPDGHPVPRGGAPGARPLSPAEEHRFRLLVERYWSERAGRASCEEEIRELEERFQRKVSWDELRALCVGTPPREWEPALRSWLDVRLLVRGQEPEVEPRGGEERPAPAPRGEACAVGREVPLLSEALPRLVVRPSRPEDLVVGGGEGAGRARLVARRLDLEGLPTGLFLEEEGGLVGVTTEWIRSWGQDRKALFRAAVSNLILRGAPEVTPGPPDATREAREGAPAPLVEARGPRVGGYCYLLARLPGAVGEAGAVFALPRYGLLLSSPLGDMEEATLGEACRAVEAGARAAFSAGPDSLSPGVYLWNRSRFLRLVPASVEPIPG